MIHKRHLMKFILPPFLFLYFATCFAMEVPIYDFPVTYSQNAKDYLSPDGEDYNKTLLSPEYQNLQLKQFYNYYYSSDAQGLSPWSRGMVTSVVLLIKKIEREMLDDFNNQNKSDEDKHYAENFQEHDQAWWNGIRNNMDLYALHPVSSRKKIEQLQLQIPMLADYLTMHLIFFMPAYQAKAFLLIICKCQQFGLARHSMSLVYRRTKHGPWF